MVSSALVLASGSVTRHALLAAAGLTVECLPSKLDEQEIKRALHAKGANAAAIADRLAELKARRTSSRRPGALVIGADQMLECDNGWFDKPTDRAQAAAHLRALSGRTHVLISAVAVCRDDRRLWGNIDRARLTMRPLSEAFIDDYLDRLGAAALASAGAYQLEGLGAQLFERVEGDFFTVLGLPLLPLLGFLRAHGVIST